jgi:hypothetical protein
MLSESQAREIVSGSIRKMVPGAVPANHARLHDLGFNSQTKLNDLAETIAADSNVGVPRFEHDLSIKKFIDEIQPATTIEELTDRVLRLSAGKLCSNPHNPHDQKCCPYPAKCPECGYVVV